MFAKTLLSIDPGTSKCGLALVHRDEEGVLQLVWHNIVPTENLPVELHVAMEVQTYSLIVVGSGTHSRQVQQSVRNTLPSMGILVIDEKDTTLQARERYWEHNPRRGWRKLLPSSLQVPPVPIDDFAALVLAERVLLQP